MGKLNPSCKQSLPPTTIPCLSVSKILILPRGNQTLRDLLPPPSQLHSWSPSPNQSFLLTSLFLQPQFYKPRTWTMRQPLTGFQPFSLSLSLPLAHSWPRAPWQQSRQSTSLVTAHSTCPLWCWGRQSPISKVMSYYPTSTSNSGHLLCTWARPFEYFILPIFIQLCEVDAVAPSYR